MGYLLIPILVLQVLLVMPINGIKHELHFGIGLGRTHYHHPMEWHILGMPSSLGITLLIKTRHNSNYVRFFMLRKGQVETITENGVY